MFDPKRDHGIVQGDGVGGAKFYQDGHYYGADHRYLFSNPGSAPPPGQKLRSMEQAEAAMQQRILDGEPTPPPPPAVPAVNSAPTAPGTPPSTDQAPDLTPEQKLNQLHVPQLQALQLQALQAEQPEADVSVLKKSLIGGPGSKQKLIAWLLERTTE